MNPNAGILQFEVSSDVPSGTLIFYNRNAQIPATLKTVEEIAAWMVANKQAVVMTNVGKK